VANGAGLFQIAVEAGALHLPADRRFVRRRATMLAIDIDDRNRGTELGKRFADRSSDMARAAGNNRHPALQRHEVPDGAFARIQPNILWNSSAARCRSSSRPTSIQYSRKGNTTEVLP